MPKKSKEKSDCVMSFRGPQKLIDRIDEYAERLGIDRAATIKMALNIWLEAMDQQGGQIMPNLSASKPVITVETGNQNQPADNEGKAVRRIG